MVIITLVTAIKPFYPRGHNSSELEHQCSTHTFKDYDLALAGCMLSHCHRYNLDVKSWKLLIEYGERRSDILLSQF